MDFAVQFIVCLHVAMAVGYENRFLGSGRIRAEDVHELSPVGEHHEEILRGAGQAATAVIAKVTDVMV